MSKPAHTAIQVVCPCCQAHLSIDPDLKAVLHHEPPPKPPVVADLHEAGKMLKTEASRREDRFQESVQAEKTKGKVLEKRFEELLKKAKEEPGTPPPRPFDFD